eukprot:6376509-Amphidinium_carterae.1
MDKKSAQRFVKWKAFLSRAQGMDEASFEQIQTIIKKYGWTIAGKQKDAEEISVPPCSDCCYMWQP